MVHIGTEGMQRFLFKCGGLEAKADPHGTKLTFEPVRATCAQVSERLRRVIRAKEGYIE